MRHFPLLSPGGMQFDGLCVSSMPGITIRRLPWMTSVVRL
jgi:hypothetical protein